MDISVELSVFYNIKYYDEPHTYFIDGKEMTSVTRLINKFKQLAAMAGIDGYPGKDGTNIPEEEISDFLENILTPEEFDQVRSDYLWELGSVITRARNKAVVEEYDEMLTIPSYHVMVAEIIVLKYHMKT